MGSGDSGTAATAGAAKKLAPAKSVAKPAPAKYLEMTFIYTSLDRFGIGVVSGGGARKVAA
jgi:hypothetical protein